MLDNVAFIAAAVAALLREMRSGQQSETSFTASGTPYRRSRMARR